MFLTRELFETIARAEVMGIRATVEAMRQLYPDSNAESIELGGGLAAFTGTESPLSKTFGLGVLGPATAEDVDRITDFYETRNAIPRLFVNPFTDFAVTRVLAGAGYAPASYDSVLAVADPDLQARRDTRIGVASDFGAWARASARGFVEHDHGLHDDSLARIVGSAGGVIPLEAREDAAIVATAAMSVRDDCASLFAGSTLPEYRNRGWQGSLIRDRIARAREAGARIIWACAEPGSASERNFHRCGFVTLFTRARWDKLPPPT